ncbi:MAG: SPOR domain-containing protein [Gammaproteobacteria bacterium]|nr:SPOR domain-containing protein [Gammaproteobacteria bacterium]
MAIKRHGKKKARRKSATRRGQSKPFPQWALLSAGLVAGLVVAGLVQLIVIRASQPDSGLRNLVTQNKNSSGTSGKESATQPNNTQPQVAKYDFYTILPEVETVLPDLGAEPASRINTEQDVHYILQAGSFGSFEDADRLKAKLALNGLVAHIQKISIDNKGDFHRVRLGPYKNLKELDATSKRLKQLGIPALRLSVKQSDT